MLPDTFCFATPELDNQAKAIKAPKDQSTQTGFIGVSGSAPSTGWNTFDEHLKVESGKAFRSELAAPDAEEFHSKWQETVTHIRRDIEIALHCNKDPLNCESAGARALLAVAKHASKSAGFAQLAQVNREINLAISYTSDMAQYGVLDYWASPIETLTNGAGDCEDYAIAKYAVLRLLGIPEQHLQLVIVREQRSHQLHAVLEVMYGGTWRILDSRTMILAAADQARHYNPISVLVGRPETIEDWATLASTQHGTRSAEAAAQ